MLLFDLGEVGRLGLLTRSFRLLLRLLLLLLLLLLPLLVHWLLLLVLVLLLLLLLLRRVHLVELGLLLLGPWRGRD